MKLDAWKKRENERLRQKIKMQERRDELINQFNTYLEYFEVTPELIHETRFKYDEFHAELKNQMKDEKFIMDQLRKMSENHTNYSMRDLERIKEHVEHDYHLNKTVQDKIIQLIERECNE
jgi:hypothetical protein